ncbi:helix-turn-helix domain-containing protein [Roseovarius sp. SCSIO 43702]|uniref:helix-turn-helix domain-containing protein n=1 Tax=Roseovarius sp. SCSIO 43702 TaxID=2823043 RepID=UPI001C739563|nr:helix-turn-helix domain-containing protein [Roseovarius sp. SCSIO 43702]QYX56471.1 helix-turn-helix domain-containing protein [Roseovarius sp. SCSIO 43702]
MTQHPDLPDARSLGADLRALRKSRGITLSWLAERLGRSVGWLSQVERDMSAPSVGDLRHIAAALDVPISMLFGHAAAPAEEAGYVVRRGARRRLGSGEGGLIEELLSPDLTDDFEMVHSTFAPRSRAGEVIRRDTQEVGFMISGRLDLWIEGRTFTVGPGDSFRIRGEAHEWVNPYDEAAVAIWVIAPPTY